jgi:ubiquitin-activating enzyme E1
LFVSGADSVNSLLEDREQFFQKLKQDPLSEADALRSVNNWLSLAAQPSFEQCAKVLYLEFIAAYRDALLDLTHNFPKDARMTDAVTGADLGAFWHGHKRFPQVANFDPSNDAHVEYIYAGANILAHVFGLKEHSKDDVRALLPKLIAADKPWQPSGKKIVLDAENNKGSAAAEEDKKPESVSEEDHELVGRLTAELRALDLSKFKPLNSTDFEKDDDKNHHIDWITSATNLRCWNYNIKETTRHKCRMISGKIIPALATTTATITGFIGVELYKYVMGAALESYRAASINLATNVFCVENLPDPAYRTSGLDQATQMQVVAVPEKFTCWDTVVVDKPGLTLQQFIDEVSAIHHGVVIDALYPIAAKQGVVLYNAMDAYDSSKKDALKARLATPLVDLWVEQVGAIFPKERAYLLFDCTVETESGDPGIVPIIRYNFRK